MTRTVTILSNCANRLRSENKEKPIPAAPAGANQAGDRVAQAVEVVGELRCRSQRRGMKWPS